MLEEDNPPILGDTRKAFGIEVARPSHLYMRQLKERYAPTEHGFKLWNSTWILLNFLEGLDWPPQARVLDAGCGWGLAGIYCARQHGARVTAADVDSQVFPYLAFHAQLNRVDIQPVEMGFDQLQMERLKPLDLLIGADICFNATLVEPLYALLQRAVEAGVERIAIADPGRHAFLRVAERCTRRLSAHVRAWETTEPMLDWAGAPVVLQGHILLIGDW
jgi:predicted nicotinamide N-methyase